jgi:hypothetical protein
MANVLRVARWAEYKSSPSYVYLNIDHVVRLSADNLLTESRKHPAAWKLGTAGGDEFAVPEAEAGRILQAMGYSETA